jgi:hypothetical protein
VFFLMSGSFRAARKYFSRLRGTFRNPESFTTTVKMLSGFWKCFPQSAGNVRDYGWTAESEPGMENKNDCFFHGESKSKFSISCS